MILKIGPEKSGSFFIVIFICDEAIIRLLYSTPPSHLTFYIFYCKLTSCQITPMKRLFTLFTAFFLLWSGISPALADELQESPDLLVSAGKKVSGVCEYSAQISRSNADEELNQQVEDFLQLVSSTENCPDRETTELPQYEYTCRTEEQVFYEDMKQLQDWVSTAYLPENLGEMLPDDERGVTIMKELERLLEAFERYYERQEEAYYELLSSPCDRYRYIDFPGEERFGDRGYEDVELLYDLQPIMSGLVPNEMLGTDMNLVRSHALTALWRILNDNEGIMSVFFEEQKTSHRFVDIEDNHPLAHAFPQFAKGYLYSEVLTGVKLERLSWIDLAFLKNTFQARLMREQPELKTYGRFLLPASDILHKDLYHLIQKTFEMSAVVAGLAEESGMSGLHLNLDSDLEKMTRLEALPVFYQLQQLNYMLKEHFDEAGFVINDNGQIGYKNMVLTPSQALPYFKESMMQRYGTEVGLMYALEERTRDALAEYWAQWNQFQKDTDSQIKAINEATHSIHEPVSLHQRLVEIMK